MIGFLIVLAGVSIIIQLIWKRYQSQQWLRRVGIPGPTPGFLFGNLQERNIKGITGMAEYGHKKYGKTFGYYEGATPIICTTDVKLIKHVWIKKFNKFHSRKNFSLMDPDDRRTPMNMSRGQHWQRMKALSNRAFTPANLHMATSKIHEVIDIFLEVIDNNYKNKDFNILRVFENLTMDIIGRCGFSVDMKCLENNKDSFVNKFKMFLKRFNITGYFMKFLMLTRSLSSTIADMIGKLNLYSPYRDAWIEGVTRNIAEDHLNNASAPEAIPDFLYLMLKENGMKNIHSKNLCVEDIQGIVFTLFEAGFGMTSEVLGYLTYHLALNQEIQDKIRQEVDSHFPHECKPDFKTLENLEYLDMALCEILRLYYIGACTTNRHCYEDSLYEDFPIKAGTVVSASINVLHMDPDIWGPEDPSSFIPERFSAERKQRRDPVTFMPFGVGQRQCLGMRFAMGEIKMVMARLLRQYYIKPCEKTQVPLALITRGPLRIRDGIFIRLTPRIPQ